MTFRIALDRQIARRLRRRVARARKCVVFPLSLPFVSVPRRYCCENVVIAMSSFDTVCEFCDFVICIVISCSLDIIENIKRDLVKNF